MWEGTWRRYESPRKKVFGVSKQKLEHLDDGRIGKNHAPWGMEAMVHGVIQDLRRFFFLAV